MTVSVERPVPVPPPTLVHISMTLEEARTLRELLGWDVTIPLALQNNGASNKELEAYSTLMNTLHTRLVEGGI